MADALKRTPEVGRCRSGLLLALLEQVFADALLASPCMLHAYFMTIGVLEGRSWTDILDMVHKPCAVLCLHLHVGKLPLCTSVPR